MRSFLILLATAGFLSPAWAADAAQKTAAAPAQTSAAAAEKSADPAELTRRAAEQVLANIKQNRSEYEANEEALYSMVDEVVLKNFDFRTMSLLVLGPHWKQASEAQQERFIKGFKNLLIRTYAKALLQYGDAQIEWQPSTLQPGDKRTLVEAKVPSSAGDVRISWRLRDTDEGWRVYDVIVDSISLVTNYRGSYNAEIRKVGMDGLLDKLEAGQKQES